MLRVHGLYLEEERSRDIDALRAGPGGLRMFSNPRLRLRDANEIMPHGVAKTMFFHGMGPHGLWKGWAPFSDWFRYEVLSRFGGWWVDADSVSVQNLGVLSAEASELICATERHRRDRRRLGALAMAKSKVPSKVARWRRYDGGSFKDWADQASAEGLELCLLCNCVLRAPKGAPVMVALAGVMRERLERYAEQVRERGISGPNGVTALSSACRLRCALPNGMLGSALLQRSVQKELEPLRLRPLHWSLFNPVEVTDPERMHRVLQGREALPSHVMAVHFFRKVRDEWSAMGLSTPKISPVLKMPDHHERVQGTHLQGCNFEDPNEGDLRPAAQPNRKRSFLELLEKSRQDCICQRASVKHRDVTGRLRKRKTQATSSLAPIVM